MSLFFIRSRRPKQVIVDIPADLDEALEAASKGGTVFDIASAGHISIALAERLLLACRAVEPQLLAAIQDGTVTTQASAGQFLQDHVDGPFPVAKFIARLKVNVGSEASPATWAEVIAAAQDEEIG